MSDDLIRHYGDALDEIYALRRALAYEAEVITAHLAYKSFPKSRRVIAELQVERMRASARGDAGAYASINTNYRSVNGALSRAGAPSTLTRHQWEHRFDAEVKP